MKLSCVISKIEERIPKKWAESWDNPGLLCGDRNAEISKIAVALNATPQTVAQAAEKGCGLLLTHHPIIFHPIKSVTCGDISGRTIISAVKSGIALYAAHTNWDFCAEGVNVTLASLIGLTDIKPLSPSEEEAWGICSVGAMNKQISPSELAKLLHDRWGVSRVFYFGDKRKNIKKIAIGGGACQEYWCDALHAGADAFVTADVSYHIRKEIAAAGLALFVCDHGEMESASLPALKKAAEEQTGLECVMVKDDRDPFYASFSTDINEIVL